MHSFVLKEQNKLDGLHSQIYYMLQERNDRLGEKGQFAYV
jgi:hypothetical protein